MTRFKRPDARFHRRGMVGAAAMAALAPELIAGQTPVAAPLVPTTALSGTSLSILTGTNSVSEYDAWFEQFAYDWGATNAVQVTVTRRFPDEIPAMLSAEIEAGSGHSLIDFQQPFPKHEAAFHDLSGVAAEAGEQFGPQLEACRSQTFNPVTGRMFGLCHGYSPFPATFRQSMWASGGLEQGPATWDDLLTTGSMIWNTQGVPVGLSLSPEPEANAMALSLIWAFGGAIQDANGQVTINSPETVAAVTHLQAMFAQCMLPEVLEWDSESNDERFANNRLSYTPNPVSEYRFLQANRSEVADDTSLAIPLAGPGGAERAVAPPIAATTAMIPLHATHPETAAAFILHLIASSGAVFNQSRSTIFPAFPQQAPGMNAELDADPWQLRDVDAGRLTVLKGGADWTRNPGWPGPTNAMIEECLDSSLLATMLASVARGEMSAEAAVADAEARLVETAERWRGVGLM